MRSGLVAVLLLTTAYAAVRYAVFGGVAVAHAPVYLLNKSLAMASVAFLLAAVWRRRHHDPESARRWGTAFSHAVILHVALSMAILSREYFPQFFAPEMMTLAGEITVVAGVLATYGFWLARRDALPVARRRLAERIATALVAVHLVSMGWSGWWKVGEWHGSLPPISLLSFVTVLVSLVRRERSAGDES